MADPNWGHETTDGKLAILTPVPLPLQRPQHGLLWTASGAVGGSGENVTKHAARELLLPVEKSFNIQHPVPLPPLVPVADNAEEYLRKLYIATQTPVPRTANGAVGRCTFCRTGENVTGEICSSVEESLNGQTEKAYNAIKKTVGKLNLATFPAPQQPLPQNGLLWTANGAVGRGGIWECAT